MVSVFFVLMIGVGNFIKKKILSTVNKKQNVQEKLQLFQTAHIIQIATVEGVGLVSTSLYMAFENLIFLGLGVLAMIIFSLRFPSVDRIAGSIGLTIEEQTYFNDPNSSLPQK
ncbi:MAG: hypothetical protein ABNH00_01395 [Dokdonia sp.]